jgi:succinate dehydrogenase / fumarate reductase cytochrome b subunit
VEEIGQEALR